MLECRYYGNCYFMECDVPDICDGKGCCVSYRNGHDVETVCSYYEPMPDVEALLKLAEKLEEEPGPICGMCTGQTARRIREAMGDRDGHE